MSFIFFFFFIVQAIIAVTISSRELDTLFMILPTFVGMISFFGSLLWIREMKNESTEWYFGIPHVIALFILVISAPLDYFIRGGHNLTYFIIALEILSITSVGFFLSFSDSRKKITRWFTLVSGLIGIYAVYTIWYLVQQMLTYGRSEGAVSDILEFIYWLIFMPLIGLCYVVTAFLPKGSIAVRTGDSQSLETRE